MGAVIQSITAFFMPCPQGNEDKMTRKNIFIIILIVLMMAATVLVGCSNKGKEENSGTEKATIVKETENTIEPTQEETTVAVSSEKETTEPPAENMKVAQPTSKPVEPTTKPTEKPTEAARVCYITVDGYCSNKQIQIKGGESVYDILKATGVSVSARTTGYGLYVEGINGRFEFDEGPTSGWVYTVNGTRPSTSCSNYNVKSGDKIVWTYVTEV
jgi:hypothetical protein